MLEGTTCEVRERSALRVNPAKTCQPVGAMYAALGIHSCMPHSHGSQGCCSYHRSHLTRHFKEPVMATTSSFTEGASVFGGLSNLVTAIDNIFSIYNPDVIAVHTTCLSEVIGDDIPNIVAKANSDGKIPEGKKVIHANTPSFVGSHVTGFASMVEGAIKYLAEKNGETLDQINLIPGYVDPSDIRELKRLLNILNIKAVTLPDTSDVLDCPQTGVYEMYPKGGTTLPEIASMGDSIATLSLGDWASKAGGIALEKKHGVPYELLELPIGLRNTDAFIDRARRLAGVSVPTEIRLERGRLLDLISDMSQYFHDKKVAIFGDPDHVIAMTRFVLELGMKPTIVITGTPGNRFETIVSEMTGENCKVRQFSDIHWLHQNIKNEPVDLLMGNTYGKYVARAEGNIPFVRFGWPVLDRVGHRHFPTLGYTGAIRLIEKITDAFFDKRDREDPDELVELVL